MRNRLLIFEKLQQGILRQNFAGKEIILFLLVFIFFIINTLYVSYPDEFVNILGGLFIVEGKIPYKDFFDHHLPFAWYFASFLLLFAGKSFVLFRVLWAVSMFLLLFSVGWWIRRNYKEFYYYYLGFFVLYPLTAVYFWFHLYLADSLAILFFSMIFWFLAVQTLTKRVHFKSILLCSFLTFCLIFSSLTFLYLALALYLWQLYLIWPNKKRILKYIGIAGLPYGVYALYLLITNSWYDFYFSNFVYNTKLYISIPNYVKGNYFNPLKFGLTLIFNFYTHYLPLLTKVKHLDLYLPIGVLAGFSTLALLALFFIRNAFVGLIFFFVLSFSAPRSTVQTQSETDYQMGMFLMLGVASTFIALYLFRDLKLKDQLIHDLTRVAQTVVSILLFFTFIFLLANTYNKFFQRYIQFIPSINNISHTANFIDSLLERDDYYWVGPYEPHESFFVKKARLPGKYPTLLPQFKEDEHLKSTFINQFEKNPPKIIIFRHESSIFNTPANQFGDFFLTWLQSRYARLEDIKGVKIIKSPSTFNIKTDVYLLNSHARELLSQLKQQGFIE